MATQYVSPFHVFSVDDITGTFGGATVADNPAFLDTSESVVNSISDKDGNVLYGVDSEFGFHVTDFIGAEQKTIDGDYAEGYAGNILNDADPSIVEGISIKNAQTDIFRAGAPLGTWLVGLGGQSPVKASTEHYATMAKVLSDQLYAEDPDALVPLDNDLVVLDQRPTGTDGALEPGALNGLYVEELAEALQRAIDNAGGADTAYSDLDFDDDGTPDPFTTRTLTVNYDQNDDGVAEAIQIGAVDLDSDGTIDLQDRALNGIGAGTTADITDILEPNEASTTFDIAYTDDYSMTVKDDGKLLYRFGTAVKRPNDIRMEVDLELPEEWTDDVDNNGLADSLENGKRGFIVTRAELFIDHDITNNPNDQIRPGDFENEAAIGRLPAYYVVEDPDDATNTLWVSPVDSYNGKGESLPSYFLLDESGAVDLSPADTSNPVYDPDGRLVGYRNTDGEGNLIGTVLRDLSLIGKNDAADLEFTSEDLSEGYTVEYFTTVDREPFEWSYAKFPDDPYINMYESFRSRSEAEAAGYSDDELESGPRWRLTPNKIGQDLPGVQVPATPLTSPPYQRDNIKYETGEPTMTNLNLLDWEGGPSPFAHSSGWMVVDPTRLDEDKNGEIDEGWANVQTLGGTFDAGDAVPTDLILSAVTPNGINLNQNFMDAAVYVKGDRQDSAKVRDMYMEVDYVDDVIGTVQKVTGLTDAPQTLTYEGGETFENAVVFASPLGSDDIDPADVAVTSVGATGATVFVDEPNYLDGTHGAEDVTMLTFEEGNWLLGDGTRVEVGTADWEAGELERPVQVDFDGAFEEAPVVLVQLQTSNGGHWDVVRIRDVTTTGFEFTLEEEEGQTDNWHTNEVVGWAAIDSADASGIVDWGDVAGQVFSADKAVDHDGFVFDFDEEVGTDPLIAANMASYFGWDTTVLRLGEVTDDGTSASAEFIAQEEQSADTEMWHVKEDLGGIAFDQAGLLQAAAVHDVA